MNRAGGTGVLSRLISWAWLRSSRRLRSSSCFCRRAVAADSDFTALSRSLDLAAMAFSAAAKASRAFAILASEAAAFFSASEAAFNADLAVVSDVFLLVARAVSLRAFSRAADAALPCFAMSADTSAFLFSRRAMSLRRVSLRAMASP
jgi:hypothetical protein